MNWKVNHKYLQPVLSNYLPTEVKLDKQLVSVGENDFWRGGCWFMVYQLSHQTAKSIEEQGLEFLNEVTEPYNEKASYSQQYVAWEIVPKDHNYLFSSASSGTKCSKQDNPNASFFYLLINKEIENDHAVYSTYQGYYGDHPWMGGRFYIVPRLGIIAYDYLGS